MNFWFSPKKKDLHWKNSAHHWKTVQKMLGYHQAKEMSRIAVNVLLVQFKQFGIKLLIFKIIGKCGWKLLCFILIS